LSLRYIQWSKKGQIGTFWKEMEGSSPVAQSPLRAPLGFLPCKIDGAGRLKLPAKYLEYLEKLTDKNLFAAFWRGKARIFTNGSWERTLAEIEDRDRRERMAFRAESRGGDVELDPQGRVTLPQALRKAIELEDKAVQLRFRLDIITIFTKDQFEEKDTEVNRYEAADEAYLDSLGQDF
jgi:DNA-binding transcriptional regulator/RsmH inhibitor MraZ